MLNRKLKRDIEIILDYLWRDEERHYAEGGYAKNHIFQALKRLAKSIKYEYWSE